MTEYVATIGFFDGVHRGHGYLINQVVDVARCCGLSSMLVTFDRHPQEVVGRGYVPKLLSTLEERTAMLGKFDISRVEVLNFTEQLSLMSAKDFMKQILYDQLGVRVLIVGYDHRFGHGGGTAEDYVRWGKECGVRVVEARELGEEKVSSSAIRRTLTEGKIEQANKMLGYAYELEGAVVDGFHIGRKMGFPTANLVVAKEKLIPCRGVYAVWAELEEGKVCKGMLNIGNRPTMHNGEQISIECHLLGMSDNLYGQTLRLHLTHRLRDEQTFDSPELLREQLQRDMEKVSILPIP